MPPDLKAPVFIRLRLIETSSSFPQHRIGEANDLMEILNVAPSGFVDETGGETALFLTDDGTGPKPTPEVRVSVSYPGDVPDASERRFRVLATDLSKEEVKAIAALLHARRRP